MALDEDVSVFIAESHATCAAVALVVGIERAGEAGGGSAGGRVGKLERLHGRERSERRTNEVSEFQRAFMILKKKIVLCYFLEVRRWGRWRWRLERFRLVDLRLADVVRFLEEPPS